jgi:hypothetical protein
MRRKSLFGPSEKDEVQFSYVLEQERGSRECCTWHADDAARRRSR